MTDLDREALIDWVDERVRLDRTEGTRPAWARLLTEIGTGRFDREAARIDLTDPETETTVAEAIRRLAPPGTFVPLSARYPWRFADWATIGSTATIVDAVAEALRASATVHEAERNLALVPALTALADALEHGALITGPPPGPCGAPAPDARTLCQLRAGHAGWHEGLVWDDAVGLSEGRLASWSTS